MNSKKYSMSVTHRVQFQW